MISRAMVVHYLWHVMLRNTMFRL